MAYVRIYQPAKSAMQSGRADTDKWLLEFEPNTGKKIDPLMGWTGSGDTGQQIFLRFDSQEQAVAYAKRNGFAYRVQEPQARLRARKNYTDNFAWNKIS